jgi:hypothetical protein
VPNLADLLKQLFVDVSGAAGWTGCVLCTALPGGGVGDGVDDLAKGSWKKGRRLLQAK